MMVAVLACSHPLFPSATLILSLSCKGVRTAKTGSRATKHDPKAEQEKEKEEAKKKAEKRQARLDAAKAGGAVV
jgi:hypothetical protein